MSSAEYGVGTAAGEIYIGEFQGGHLKVFNRSGVFQRLVDVNLTLPEGVFAIGGDDVKGLTTTIVPISRSVLRALTTSCMCLMWLAPLSEDTTDRHWHWTGSSMWRNPINALAVAADGTIWGAGQDGTLYHFSSYGRMLGSLVTGVAELIDIDLNITGQILLTSRDGTVSEDEYLPHGRADIIQCRCLCRHSLRWADIRPCQPVMSLSRSQTVIRQKYPFRCR